MFRLSGFDPFNRLAEGGFSVHETNRVAMSRTARNSIGPAVEAAEQRLIHAPALNRLS
jgi:hypothetical protein